MTKPTNEPCPMFIRGKPCPGHPETVKQQGSRPFVRCATCNSEWGA